MFKFLITGSTGLIGSVLVKYLLKHNYQLVLASKNIDKLSKYESNPNVEIVYWDLSKDLSEINLVNYFKNPTHLIYLAWQGLPNYNSIHHIKINYRNSAKFISKLIEEGLQNITVIGSCFEYGKIEEKLSENILCHPTTVYGKSKLLLYNHLNQLQTCYNFNFKWLRVFYLAHKFSHTNDLFGLLNRNKNNKILEINIAKLSRDYIEIDTLVKHIYQLSIIEKNIGIVNCASGKALPLIKIVKNFAKTHNIKITINLNYPINEYEAKIFWGDTNKLKIYTST